MNELNILEIVMAWYHGWNDKAWSIKLKKSKSRVFDSYFVEVYLKFVETVQ